MKKPMSFCILILLIPVFISLTACGGGKQRTLLYIEKARGLGDVIMRQAQGDLNVCKMYDTVWEYAAVSEMDFDTAYREMMGGRPEALFLEMDTNQEMMLRMMNLTKNPPKECRGIKTELDALHKRYKKFNKFVRKTPKLSQQEYWDKVNGFIDDLNELKEGLDAAINQAAGTL